MKKITVRSAAKINLMLDVLEKLDNGYHTLWMIMQSLNLYDTVTVERTNDEEITITCNKEGVPLNEKNIAYKAAREFFESTNTVNPGIKIHIEKKIPMAAGLAGGSADGAAVLMALNELTGVKLSLRKLARIGLKVGADVPFCLQGGTMLAQDIGGLLSDLPDLPQCFIVLAKPESGVSTAEAYGLCDSRDNPRPLDRNGMLRAVMNGDLERVSHSLANVFEQVIDVPERVPIKTVMRENHALGCCMSGSGPTVFGIFENEDDAEKCAEKLRKIVPNVFVTVPVETGTDILAAE